ncbi:hypothetical protein TorRG33x02_286140 [Trema orientale]|uniref:Transmembrane protein n=1 Tax=Trema orientale TaxID=63057 RepID=A0A2P5CFZ5_TREOI|nr:hypothetical protein TorRG33x02_286140 [Trema orientale]
MFEIYSTLDLIRHVVSNPLFIFCFCNLIIVIILISSKPISNTKRESESFESTVKIRGRRSAKGGNKENKAYVEVSKGMLSSEKGEAENDRGDRANHEENDKDEDELRKRVEEFIEKVNKGWKAELLIRTSRLV